MKHLQGAACDHYLELGGKLCKNPLQLTLFLLNSEMSNSVKRKKKVNLV